MKSLLFLLVAGAAAQLDDYYSMPPLYMQDDYEECLGTGGTYCLGTFHLTGSDQNQLLAVIQDYTKKHNFNHSLLHRGVCVTQTCAFLPAQLPPAQRFEQCVRNSTITKYGLTANLHKLDYCKSKETPPRFPIDGVDIGFLAICGVILIGNLAGTLYDVFRDKSHKANRILVSWSLLANFKRLSTTFENDDTNMSRLNAIHGLKAIFLMLVMIAHSVIIYHSAYLYNPLYLEINSQHPLATILHNGSVIVQTYIILSCFLFTYNFLLHKETHPERKNGIKVFFAIVLHRLARITPISMFMVGFTATWNRFIMTGALWEPIMERETLACRSKWWAQALYVNNFYMPDDHCLIQTWFVAVDMQLYVVAVALGMALCRWPRAAVRACAALVLTAVLTNFAVCYYFDLKAIVFVTFPETLRTLFRGEPSYKWLYTSPWGSLPSSLLGVGLGFLYYQLRQKEIDVAKYNWFRVVYRLMPVAMLSWILSGYFMREGAPRALTSLYGAIDRPVFGLFICVMLLGMFYRIDRFWWRFMSWGGWQVLGRMSMSVLMVHWNYSLLQIAMKTNLSRISFYDIAGHGYVTIVMTYVTALPLHLFVEVPIQKFLQAVMGV